MLEVDRFGFAIPGPPVPLERARKGRNGFYLPAKSLEYRGRVQDAWMRAGQPTVGSRAFAMSAHFWFKRPPSHFRSGRNSHLLKAGAPTYPRVDVDNLVKAALDALQGFGFANDAQCVCLAGVHKSYVCDGEGFTRVDVWVSNGERRVAA